MRGGSIYGQIIAKDGKRTNCSTSEIKCLNVNVCYSQNFLLEIKHCKFELELNQVNVLGSLILTFFDLFFLEI